MPQISSSDVTQVDDGPEADTVIVRLSDSVGLLGVIRNNDQSLAQVVLVSVPGDDDVAANQLYQSAFDVMVRTLAPALDEAARTELAGQLGLSNSQPPFPAGTSATATVEAQRYTAGFRADLQASFISVVAAAGRLTRRQRGAAGHDREAGAEQGGDDRRHQHRHLRLVDQQLVVEGQPGDEQRHGEADAGDRRDPDDVAPPDPAGQARHTEPHGDPAEQRDADELADHQPEQHAEEHPRTEIERLGRQRDARSSTARTAAR